MASLDFSFLLGGWRLGSGPKIMHLREIRIRRGYVDGQQFRARFRRVAERVTDAGGYENESSCATIDDVVVDVEFEDTVENVESLRPFVTMCRRHPTPGRNLAVQEAEPSTSIATKGLENNLASP